MREAAYTWERLGPKARLLWPFVLTSVMTSAVGYSFLLQWQRQLLIPSGPLRNQRIMFQSVPTHKRVTTGFRER